MVVSFLEHNDKLAYDMYVNMTYYAKYSTTLLVDHLMHAY